MKKKPSEPKSYQEMIERRDKEIRANKQSEEKAKQTKIRRIVMLFESRVIMSDGAIDYLEKVLEKIL